MSNNAASASYPSTDSGVASIQQVRSVADNGMAVRRPWPICQKKPSSQAIEPAPVDQLTPHECSQADESGTH